MVCAMLLKNSIDPIISLLTFDRGHLGRGSTIVLGPKVPQSKTDDDILEEEKRFIWRDEDMAEMTAEKQFAIRYYQKLFKEYCK